MAGLKRISGVLSPDALQKSTQNVALMIVHVFKVFFLGSVFVKIYCVSRFGSGKLHCNRFFVDKDICPMHFFGFSNSGSQSVSKNTFFVCFFW